MEMGSVDCFNQRHKPQQTRRFLSSQREMEMGIPDGNAKESRMFIPGMSCGCPA